jgi:energy-coupling factor transporter ATP-binding protein EcfA2
MSGREWLRGIEIQNFRGIESLHLSFVGPDDKASPVVVVAGPNGCGKTTVLEACLLVAGEPSVTKELVTGAVDSRGVRRGAEDFIIRGFFEGDAGTNEADFGPVFSGNTRRLDCEYFSSWRAPVLPGALSVTAGKPGKRPRKEVKNRLWIVKQHLVNAKAYDRMSSQGPSNAPSKFDRAIDKVNQLWRMFYPDTEQTFSVEPAGESPDAGFDVFLNESGGRIPLDALSSGQLELFLLAGSALPGEEVPSLLCIDEPELHLDPQWHRLILRALQKLRPETQIIVGTHSPEIYEAVLSHQRHFLVPSDDPRAKVWSTPSSGAAKE